MGRKSKVQLEAEYKKARTIYLRHSNNFFKCHEKSSKYEDLRMKAIAAEEECVFLNRKIHNWKENQPDKFIL